MNISTRSIVYAGVLLAITLLLALTRIGYFPVPNLTGEATILHIPPIIGGVLEGPIVGAIIGLVFGITTYFLPTVQPLFAGQPIWLPILVLVVPRLLVGVVAWLTWIGLRRIHPLAATALSGLMGGLVAYGLLAWTSAVMSPLWSNLLSLAAGGLVAALLTYLALNWNKEIVALGAAGILGSACNTALVLYFAITFDLLPAEIVPLALPQAAFEAVAAALLTVVVVTALKGIDRGKSGSTV